MKFTVTLIVVLLGSFSNAQIPNAGFENWHPVGNDQGEDPDHWESNNLIVDTPGIEKSTDAHSGNYALRINATAIPEQSPIIILGDIEFDTSMTPGNFPGLIDASCSGTSINRVPQVLTGYYKFVAPAANEGTANVGISANTGCTGFPWGGTVFFHGKFRNFRRSQDSTGRYRFFAVAMQHDEIDTLYDGPIDTLNINATLQIDTLLGEVDQGYLLLDDLQLLGSLSQSEYAANASLSVFPNPARKELHLVVSKAFEAHTLEVYDLKGGFAFKKPFRSPLNISSLAPGMYLVKIKGAKGELVETFVVR